MIMSYRCRRDGKQIKKMYESLRNSSVRLAVFFVCLFMLTGFSAMTAQAEDGKQFSDIVTFDSITLHYAGSDGQPEKETVQDGTLLKKNKQLVLRYTYTITEKQCGQITAGTKYYLKVSPHLVLPNLGSGSALVTETENGEQKFGTINADGRQAWVIFDPQPDGTDTILSEYGELNDAYFFLNCSRAEEVPSGESPITGENNLYAMKFENDQQLSFGYAENEPVSAKAQVNKDGSLQDKTITWTIDYTPWQNPSDSNLVNENTYFELRDTIDIALHSYVEKSVTVDGKTVTVYFSRDDVQGGEDVYVIAETLAGGGNMTLCFGGTKFGAGKATQGNPAAPIKITYQTVVNDDLLLPGKTDGQKITNAAELFAGENGVFNNLGISGSKTMSIPQLTWLAKEGITTRHPEDGNGSTTDWTVTFKPNGFQFGEDNRLTLHDQLPEGSTLVENSVMIDGEAAAATAGTSNDFTVSGIVTDRRDVIITYQTHVPEEMYDSGTNLGSNTAWFTFDYNGSSYSTPMTTTPIGSGDGSGTPGTETLIKTNTGYHADKRTIEWTVKINPHQANLKKGTFTDDLSKIGGVCRNSSHTSGLELLNGTNGIVVKINGKDPTDDENKLVNLAYDQQKLIVKVGEIGAKTITLTYTTKVCDPCIFANNTVKTEFKNTISTKDMVIGSQSTTERSVSADSTANVSATVLAKKAPVYDYASGIMKWTVEVDGAGLSMEDIVLTDTLPGGLTYVDNSFTAAPEISGASASVSGQEVAIRLGTVTEKTTVTFDTAVDPKILGFGSDKPVVVENTIHMNGKADGVMFTEVSHRVENTFSNHGLVKSSQVDNQQELIQYEVLINPYHLALPESPSLVDTLDSRLQLDTDTLRFYEANLSGTTITTKDQRPNYTKKGDGRPLKITGFDPETNRFTTQLPIEAGSTDTYVLTYTADIIERQAGGYGNSVRFEGGSVLLGGSKDNSASVGGGGGGGGGGVAARKAAIAIIKVDSETQKPLPGVSFMLYQWDEEAGARGLPFAQGKTDAEGKLSFTVKPGAYYELVETESIPGYSSAFGWKDLPGEVLKTDDGLLMKAGAAKSELKLELTNEFRTVDIEFRLINEAGIPMAGEKVKIFTSDPAGEPDPVSYREASVSYDGLVRFLGVRRGGKYYVLLPGGGIMTIEIPVRLSDEPKVILPDGTSKTLSADYQVTGITPQEQQWTVTVSKVIAGGTEPLAGAVIGLYADAACQSLIKTDVSAQDGTITFPGVIKGRQYWLKETEAPSNYYLDSTVYEADEASSVVTIENTPEASTVNPDNPDADDRDESDKSDNSDNPAESDKSGGSGNPAESDKSGGSGNPAESDKSDSSGNPVKPDKSDSSGNPADSDIPDEPGDSRSPDTLGTPDDSAESSNSGKAGGESSVSPANDSDIPQTGDNTQILIAAALLLESLLLAAALYLGIRRREKK